LHAGYVLFQTDEGQEGFDSAGEGYPMLMSARNRKLNKVRDNHSIHASTLLVPVPLQKSSGATDNGHRVCSPEASDSRSKFLEDG
jgi:hypothetical protein